MSSALPPSVRLLFAIAAENRRVNPRDAYKRVGLSIRAGKPVMTQLLEAGWVDGDARWVGVTEAGRDAAGQFLAEQE